MQFQMRRFLGLLAVAALVASTALGARAFAVEGRFERTLNVTGPVDLDVSTGSGDITVRTGNATTVHVVGIIKSERNLFSDTADIEKRIRAIEANPPVVQHGNIIKIGQIEDRELTRNISISYQLVVPAETRLRSETGSGDQAIQGLARQVEASSGSGDIALSNTGDTVRTSTGSGDISIEGTKGHVHASTGSGDIKASGIGGGFHASSGSGDIELEQTASGDVDVDSASGTVNLRGVHGSLRVQTASGNVTVDGQGQGTWKLNSASGNIRIGLPSQQGFDLRAHTVSGSINTKRQLTVQGSISDHELNGKYGKGEFLLEVSTVSGDVAID
ncbi:MAG: DUF4097 domain-containing protein [Acidobacteriia bacterium]|nr:DUF4097 domain-containing protein [Terriglobia bacterium]